VRLVMTYQNAPRQGTRDDAVPDYWRACPSLSTPEIHHYGEPVALVVATSYEEARAAAELVVVSYAVEKGDFDFGANQNQAYAPKSLVFGLPTDTAVGDMDAAFASAAVKVDQVYSTSYVLSHPMEPHACLAVPQDGKLLFYVSTQIVDAARASIASTLQLDREMVRVIAPYVGGGFGSKLRVHDETILAGLAARALNQPVKVALTRQQIFHVVGLRPASSQRIRLGALTDGRMVALAHEISMHTNPHMEYVEPTALGTRSLYAAPNRLTRHRLVPLDLPVGEDVLAPGDAPGSLALESAMDELACALGIDPIELRVVNEPLLDPERGIPFSDRRLVQCMREGARRFGWAGRPLSPASMRDGRWLVGYGMAAAIRAHPQTPTKVRVRLNADGGVVVESDMTDIGTGSYTVIGQTAAEMMGVPLDKVVVRLGDSAFPVSCGSGGQWGANNSTAGVYAACVKLREAVAQKLGFNSPHVSFADGMVNSGNRSAPLAQAAAEGDLVAEDAIEYGKLAESHQQSTFGAHFVEVGVDAATAEIRIRRMLAVCAAGRILNPKTARSQVIGAMTMGAGAALMEELVVDKRSGFFVNHDLAGYEVPVHADIPHQDVIFLDETDPMSSPMKAKGVGELGICGVGAAIANAIYNATGIRVRDYPITLDKLLDQLPSIG